MSDGDGDSANMMSIKVVSSRAGYSVYYSGVSSKTCGNTDPLCAVKLFGSVLQVAVFNTTEPRFSWCHNTVSVALECQMFLYWLHVNLSRS